MPVVFGIKIWLAALSGRHEISAAHDFRARHFTAPAAATRPRVRETVAAPAENEVLREDQRAHPGNQRAEMSKRPFRSHPIEIVCHATQNEQQRLAMIMMQLDMALAMARQKRLVDVESHLEQALARVRETRNAGMH